MSAHNKLLRFSDHNNNILKVSVSTVKCLNTPIMPLLFEILPQTAININSKKNNLHLLHNLCITFYS